MGAEDERKRQAAQAVTAARGSGGGNRAVIASIVVVVVLAVGVGVAVWLSHRNKPELPNAIPVAAAGPEYPVATHGDSVVTGNPQAPVTIDVYEDFLCPVCGQFEKLYHPRFAQAAVEGKAKVVYHPVAILDERSAPVGYSTLAAGATLCAAEAGIFPRFHDSLFGAQPQEGGRGWTSEQLQQLGRALGAGDGFTRCMQTDPASRITAATENASRYISGLRSDHRFGTPSIVVNGAVVDLGNEGWLDQALSGARR